MSKRKGHGKKTNSKLVAKVDQLWRQAQQLLIADKLDETERTLRAILALAPDHYGSLIQLAYLARSAGKKPIALEYAKKAVQVNHGDAEGHLVLGEIVAELGLADLAEAELTIAQQLNAGDSRIPNALGRVLVQQGRGEEAEVLFRHAIALAPFDVGAYYNLVANKKVQMDDPDIAAIENLRKHASQFSQEEKVGLYFSLAKVYHDCGEYDQAFADLQQANQLKRTLVEYRSESQQKLTDLMIQTVDANFVDRLNGVGCPSVSPVFVLGMARSGTTLVENLLSRHPQIKGIGEASYINNLAWGCEQYLDSAQSYPQFLSDLSADLCQQLGEEYVRLTQQFGVDAERVVDKTPGNFLFVGFILALLPNAKIIHCVRNPVDTCLSIYQQYFTNGLNYSYDLAEIGEYYVQYRRLMEHWHNLFPGKILNVAYEEVVMDAEQAQRRMVDFCGLDWDDRCLQMPGKDVTVRTASAWQVRQPIYHSSIQRWRQYERYLGPLLKALQPVLEEGAR